jgi:hypothetical protein
MTTPVEPVTALNITDVISGPIPPRIVNASWPKMLHTRVRDVVATMGPPPWSVRLIQDERNLVTLIATPPGSGNRPHWHKDFDEWWVIMAGRLQWELTGGTLIEANKDCRGVDQVSRVLSAKTSSRRSRRLVTPCSWQ